MKYFTIPVRISCSGSLANRLVSIHHGPNMESVIERIMENELEDLQLLYIPCENDNVHFDGWGG